MGRFFRKLKRICRQHRKILSKVGIIAGIAIIVVIAILFLTGRIKVPSKVSSELDALTESTEPVKGKIENIHEDINKAVPEDKEWMYGTGRVSYQGIYDGLVCSKESSYSKCLTEDAKTKWLEAYNIHFGYSKDTSDYLHPHRVTDPKTPDTITVKDACSIAEYCKVSVKTTKACIDKIKPVK